MDKMLGEILKIKVPETLMSQKDDITQGAVVALIFGRGCRPGIVNQKSKRKSLVYFPYDGKKEWIENKRLFVVHDKKWIAEVLRSV